MSSEAELNCSRKCKVYTTLGFVLLATVATAGGYVLLKSQEAQAKEPLGRSVPESSQVSIDQIDHSQLDQLLKKYVDADGYIDYVAWHKSSADRRLLKSYLSGLSKADPQATAKREARLAFWINAYNALTIEGILQVYPTKKITDHTAKLFGYNIWKDLPILVGGKKHSLDHIEHQILRKMNEPRIHFAIVCASVGCPRLLNEAYTGAKLEKQLTVNAVDFFSRTKNLQYDKKRNALYLSSILSWFGGDFGKTQSERLAYIRPYVPEGFKPLMSSSGISVKSLDYNWNLNDQASKPRESRHAE